MASTERCAIRNTTNECVVSLLHSLTVQVHHVYEIQVTLRRNQVSNTQSQGILGILEAGQGR